MYRKRIVASFESTGEIIEFTLDPLAADRTNHTRLGREIIKRIDMACIRVYDQERVTIDISLEPDD